MARAPGTWLFSVVMALVTAVPSAAQSGGLAGKVFGLRHSLFGGVVLALGRFGGFARFVGDLLAMVGDALCVVGALLRVRGRRRGGRRWF